MGFERCASETVALMREGLLLSEGDLVSPKVLFAVVVGDRLEELGTAALEVDLFILAAAAATDVEDVEGAAGADDLEPDKDLIATEVLSQKIFATVESENQSPQYALPS